MAINYEQATRLLQSVFQRVEAALMQGDSLPEISNQIRVGCDVIFQSRTQAYREVLLGCVVAKILDRRINIRLPYVEQGKDAFSGRSLDERVINPLLQGRLIPCSRGPYLSVFRRSVRFEEATRSGLRDKEAYSTFLRLLGYVEAMPKKAEVLALLDHLVYRFLRLREESTIPLMRLQRLSLQQYDALITGLLDIPSGGRVPVLLVVATFSTIKEFFNLDWEIVWQGINVADAASRAGGDITVSKGGKTLMAAEVTERPLDKSRVVTTFNTKISPAGIEDYLFFVRGRAPAIEAMHEANRYFAQGHEINFLEIKNWIIVLLATMGRVGRTTFNRVLIELLESAGIPKALKVKWNELFTSLIFGSP